MLLPSQALPTFLPLPPPPGLLSPKAGTSAGTILFADDLKSGVGQLAAVTEPSLEGGYKLGGYSITTLASLEGTRGGRDQAEVLLPGVYDDTTLSGLAACSRFADAKGRFRD